MRSRYRDAERTKNRWAVFTILSCVVLVFFLPSIFAWVDCNTATRQLAYVDQCEQDERCSLTARELQRYKAYLRMQAMTCPRD